MLSELKRKLLNRKRAKRSTLAVLALVVALVGTLNPSHDIKAASCVLQGNTITVSCDFAPGTYWYNGTFTVNSGVTVTAGSAASPGQVIIIADDFVIDGAINANGLGSAGGAGACPGTTSSQGGGGCHAGDGGRGSGNIAGGIASYGSTTSPSTIGSGGGDDTNVGGTQSGAGGGAVKIATWSATGTLVFGAAGSVTANGANSSANEAGGGAGGSVWIDVGDLDVQDGTVTANGGNGTGSGTTGGGGGGGGHVAIHFTSTSGTLAQVRQSHGGNRGTTTSFAAQPGGAGTIHTWDKDLASGALTVDANNQHDVPMTRQTSGDSYTVSDFTVRNGAQYIIRAGDALTVESGGTVVGGGPVGRQPKLWIQGTFNAPSEAMTISGLDIHQNGTIGTLKYLTFDNGLYSVEPSSALFSAGPGNRLGSLVLSGSGTTTYSATGTGTFYVDLFQAKSNVTLTHATNTTSHLHSLNISATSSIAIDSGALVSLAGRGFVGGACNNVGTGTGAGTFQSGGSHGGDGGAGGNVAGTSAAPYGSATSPTTIGSGGGGVSGCGSGAGGGGAGAVRLSAPGGTVTIGGTITANGGAGSGVNGGGGGAGGSVFIEASTVAGAGTINVRGGAGSGSAGTNGGGGGGGGRIAVTYADGDPNGWTLQSNGGAFGGAGNSGGAGTIFLDDTDDAFPNGTLILDNNNNTSSETSSQTVTTLTYDTVVIRNGAKYGVPSGRTFTLPTGGTVTPGGTSRPGITVRGGGTLNANTSNWAVVGFDVDNSGTLAGPTQLQFRGARLSLRGNGKFFTPVTDLDMQTDSNLDQESTDPNFDLTSLTIPAGSTVTRTGGAQPFGPDFMNLTVNGTYVDDSALELFVDTMTVNSGGLVTHATNTNTTVQTEQLIISATSTINILPGGSVSTVNKGFQGACFTGRGPGGSGNGGLSGAHGGNGGGTSNGVTYGSTTEPSTIGSSGSGHNNICSNGFGGHAGGAIKLTAGGTILVAGTVTSSGSSGTAGSGGSGGSIWIDAGTLTGGGAITAVGANGSNTGGGGGRIALYYDTDSGTGTRAVNGGTGFGSNHGGAGTFFIDDKDDALPNGTLVIDNNNINGAATTQSTIASQTYDVVDIREAGKYTVPSGHTLALGTGGSLVGGGSTKGTLTVNSGGTFNPNATDFTFGQVNITNSGTISTVTALDVGGSTVTLSGAGTFAATLTSLTLQSSTFTQGSSNPGMNVTSLVMNASTYNNNSTNPGLNLPNMNLGSSNTFNNNSASYYPLGSGFTDLTIFGNFTQNAMTTLFVDDLVIQSGGLLMHATNTSTTVQDKGLDISATSSISVLAGGTVSVAARGYTGSCGNSGFGPGQATGGGSAGAGHGGHGGHNGTSGGGAVYGSATSPRHVGSSGAGANGFCSNGVSGAGGGAMKLTTAGTFLAAGTITANAANGASFAGGGAGGSIWIEAGTLTGGSAFNANGGNPGGSSNGGGGGGGRITLIYATDSSTGTRTAYGGANAFSGQRGGAGTIFLDDTDDASPNGALIVHNNNQAGAATTQVNGLSQTYDAVTIQAGASYVIPSGNTLAVASSGALTVGGSTRPTITVNSGGTLDLNTANLNLQNVNVTNAGTMPDVTTLTYGSGTFTHSGSFSAGLTDLTVQSGGNFVHATMAQLFTGSELIVENGGVFTQSSSTTLEIDTVTIESGGLLTHCDNTTTHACSVNISATTFTVEPGASVNVDGRGFDSTTGDGQGGDGTAGGGAGHGGTGGRGVVSSVAQGTSGVAYGTSTSPDKLGSGGGDDTNNANQQGGGGGGAIILTVTGTFTQNGDLSADGANGTANEGGGGSGGSIWLTLGGWTGSGTVTAVGGTGSGNDTTGGGCGGGGRIYVTYAGKSYTGGAPSAVAGSGCTGLRTATDGTFLEEQSGGPPVNGPIVINPSNPEIGQNVVVSATATDDDGVAKIEIYLDGSAPGNLIETCLFSPVETPASCQAELGSLSVGSHSVTVVSYDEFDATDSDTLNFSVAGRTSTNRLDLSRTKAGETAVVSLTFTLSATSTGTLELTFPAGFTVTSAATSGSGCLSSFDFTSNTMTATKTDCSGTVTMQGGTVTNPVTPGAYTVTWTNDNGSSQVFIVEDDSFNIAASVDPIITFNIGAQAAATACDGTFSGNGGVLGLGTLTTSAVASSDVSSVPHICTRLSTNAPGGAVVTVRSQNGALASTASPGDTIPSSTATLTPGTAGYGLCGGSGGSDTGRDATTPVGATPVRSVPFGGTCSTSAHSVGALTTSPQTVWTVSDATQNAFVRIFIKAAISSSTVPHNDYTDVLTFIATATF